MSQLTATATAPGEDVPWPDPSTMVLHARRLHPLADTTALSRFRDDVWLTRAADVDNAVLAPALSFTPYPPALGTRPRPSPWRSWTTSARHP
jgi:hypothetical protein